MPRVSAAEIAQVCHPLNKGRAYPELGYYYLLGGFGGYKLVQIINEHGGVRDVLPHLGYAPAREAVAAVRSFIYGAREKEELERRGIIAAHSWSAEGEVER